MDSRVELSLWTIVNELHGCVLDSHALTQLTLYHLTTSALHRPTPPHTDPGA